MTLIEIVIAVVLMGMVVAATLTMLTATIRGTVLDRDHANGHAWLQTAADMLYARQTHECDASHPDPVQQAADIRADYNETVRNTQNPEQWAPDNIRVADLQFLYYGDGGEWHPTLCDQQFKLQRVLLEVHNPDGRIVEEVEVILGGD